MHTAVLFDKLVTTTAEIVELSRSLNRTNEPTLREKIKTHLAHVIEQRFQPLFDKLGIDDIPITAAKQLIVEQNAARFTVLDAKRRKREEEARITAELLAGA